MPEDPKIYTIKMTREEILNSPFSRMAYAHNMMRDDLTPPASHDWVDVWPEDFPEDSKG